MSNGAGSMGALLVGVESYSQFDLKKRPGTINALREVEHRLKEGGWHTRLLVNEASTMTQRSGLSQILEGVEWLNSCEQSLLILSGQIIDGRFYPADAKSTFLNQSTLSIKDLIKSLSSSTGVIIDGPVPSALLGHLPWAIVAQESEANEELVFSSYGPTQFLHSITIALNTWPQHKLLKVQEFFEFVKEQDAPSSIYNNYSSLNSTTLLTPVQPLLSNTLLTPSSDPTASESSDSSALSQSSMTQRGGRFVAQGRFQLQRILGEGGIGQVYLAKDTQLGKLRAVKLLKIPEQLSNVQRDHIRGRMIQSAKAAQELSEFSHHVVQVYDIGIDEETEMPFMVMEYLKGITLNERLYRSPTLNLEQVFEIGLTLCNTLAVAHQQNVVHRDLKPDNIMLINRNGSDLFLKLLDFDLVKVEAGEVKTQEGQILGTLEYMSPEQLKGQDIDARADVFALGAILYECFSGIRANPGKTQRELVRLLLSDGVIPLEEVAPHLPKELCTIINQCLSLDPDHRPSNATELAKKIKPLQRFQPTLSMMSFGFIVEDDHNRPLTPNTLCDETIDLSIESLSITQSNDGSKLNIPSQSQTPLLDSPTNSDKEPQASNRLALFLIGIIVCLLLGWWFTQPPSPNIEVESNSAVALIEADQGSLKQDQERTHLKSLDALTLLPELSESWDDNVQISSEQVSGLGQSRVYHGGRFAERLARLVYELHFRWHEGDPPIDGWMESKALRYQLLRRISLTHLKESKGKLYIPENLYIELLGQRPESHEQKKIGTVMKLTTGLLALKPRSTGCRSLLIGDLITEMQWIVRGQKKFNGRCKGDECLNAYTRSLKRKGRAKLRLTLNVERIERKDAVWQSNKITLKCVL